MQVVEGGDGGREVTLGMIQLLNVPRNLLDLCRKRNKRECLVKRQKRRKQAQNWKRKMRDKVNKLLMGQWDKNKQSKNDTPTGLRNNCSYMPLRGGSGGQSSLLTHPSVLSLTLTHIHWHKTQRFMQHTQTHGRCISLTLTNSPHCPPFKKGGYRFAIMTDKCDFFKVKQKICAWPQIQLRGKLEFLLQLKFGHTIVPLCSVYRQK